jgi:hypothetical protein
LCEEKTSEHAAGADAYDDGTAGRARAEAEAIIFQRGEVVFVFDAGGGECVSGVGGGMDVREVEERGFVRDFDVDLVEEEYQVALSGIGGFSGNGVGEEAGFFDAEVTENRLFEVAFVVIEGEF